MAPPPTGRKLILCVDGTNDSLDDDRTNVWRVFDALRDDVGSNQVIGYQTGVGTKKERNFITRTGDYISSAMDSGFALYFEYHVSTGYKWLADHYREGDHIFLFGFSRGAHTVRCIAGMVNKLGLLGRASAGDGTGFPIKTKEENDRREREVPLDFIKKGYKLYKDESVHGVNQSLELKKNCSITPDNPNIPIKFVGVWDTVASVGIFNSKHPPFAASNNIIHFFRHALALDEHRARFNESMWQRDTPEPKESWFDWFKTKLRFSNNKPKDAKAALMSGYGTDETNVKEVWFAGCHSDVGGGSAPTHEAHFLGRLAFRWMIRELRAACPPSSGAEVLFVPEKLLEWGMYEYSSDSPVTTAAAGATLSNGAVTSALKPSESVPVQRGEKSNLVSSLATKDDDEDIKTDIIDQLEKKPKWKILEYSLFGKNQADADGSWFQKIRWNRGQGRVVQVKVDKDAEAQLQAHPKVKIHYSAKRRQELVTKPYVPRAMFYLPGRPNKPLDLSTPQSPDWANGVELVYDIL